MSADLIFHPGHSYLIPQSKSAILALSGLVLLAAFPKPSGDPYVWCGALMELWSVWGWLYSSVVSDRYLCCEFPFILASFETAMAKNLANRGYACYIIRTKNDQRRGASKKS